MRNEQEAKSWAVYRIAPQGKQLGANAICDQREWEGLEQANQGRYFLIRADITNEGEAERLARGTSGDAKPRGRPLQRELAVP